MSQKTSMNRRLGQLSSAAVIGSYFLIWGSGFSHAAETGFALMGSMIKAMNGTTGNDRMFRFGILVLFSSPLICHAISIIITLTNDTFSKLIFIISAIPVGLFLSAVIFLLTKSGGAYLNMLIPHEFGAVLVMIGSTVGVLFNGLGFLSNKNDASIIAGQ